MKARLITAAAAVTMLTLASGTAAFADGPALPDGTPTVQLRPGGASVYASANVHRVGAVFVDMSFPDGRGAAGGTTYLTSVHSCGVLVKEATTTQAADLRSMASIGLSPDGMPDLSPNPVNNLIGDNALVVTVTVTEPGYAPYTAAPVSMTITGVDGPTCGEVRNPTDPTDTTITVQRWSTKTGTTGTAKVGKSLGVTPTRAPGAKVTYAWRLGTKVIDRDRVMFVRKTYAGKKVTLRVTVSKVGAKTLTKTIGYGTAN